jgi:hypothetical protein
VHPAYAPQGFSAQVQPPRNVFNNLLDEKILAKSQRKLLVSPRSARSRYLEGALTETVSTVFWN